jgi:aspartate/methionine/tyrosine aminotransferase
MILTPSVSVQVLRKEVASMYSSVTPDEVVVMAPQEGIFLAMTAMLEPDDTVVRGRALLPCTWSIAQSIVRPVGLSVQRTII